MVLRGEFRVPSYVSPRARALLYRVREEIPLKALGCDNNYRVREEIPLKALGCDNNVSPRARALLYRVREEIPLKALGSEYHPMSHHEQELCCIG